MGTTLESVMSTKGQSVWPKEIRERRNWVAGTRLRYTETPHGVLVTAVGETREQPATRTAFGILKYSGPPATLEEMDQAISDAIEDRHARGRY